MVRADATIRRTRPLVGVKRKVCQKSPESLATTGTGAARPYGPPVPDPETVVRRRKIQRNQKTKAKNSESKPKLGIGKNTLTMPSGNLRGFIEGINLSPKLRRFFLPERRCMIDMLALSDCASTFLDSSGGFFFLCMTCNLGFCNSMIQ